MLHESGAGFKAILTRFLHFSHNNILNSPTLDDATAAFCIYNLSGSSYIMKLTAYWTNAIN